MTQSSGPATRACRVFSVRAEVPHHVLPQGTIDFGDVEAFLLELASRYQVAEVRFDPRFLERSMEVLADRLPAQVAPVEPYSNAHRQALAAFERAILDGTIRHTADEAVTGQVAATAVDRFDNGDPRRLRKLDRTRPIDAAVALALAASTGRPEGSLRGGTHRHPPASAAAYRFNVHDGRRPPTPNDESTAPLPPSMNTTSGTASHGSPQTTGRPAHGATRTS